MLKLSMSDRSVCAFLLEAVVCVLRAERRRRGADWSPVPLGFPSVWL